PASVLFPPNFQYLGNLRMARFPVSPSGGHSYGIVQHQGVAARFRFVHLQTIESFEETVDDSFFQHSSYPFELFLSTRSATKANAQLCCRRPLRSELCSPYAVSLPPMN